MIRFNITAQQVREHRDKTGLPMMQAKRALERDIVERHALGATTVDELRDVVLWMLQYSSTL